MRVIAEWGQTCRGDVGRACEQALATRTAGAWGAKYQLLRPDRLAARYAPAYWSHAPEGLQQRESFEASGMIDYGAWGEVKAACDDNAVEFIATPFDHEAVDALGSLGLNYVKVASGDITYKSLLEHIGSWPWSVILSTGAAFKAEIDQAVKWLGGGERIVFLACDLVYPCPPGMANLGRIGSLIDWYGQPVGYSDHTTSTVTGFAAGAAGAVYLEKHTTLDPAGPVPDDEMGLDPERLARYCVRAAAGRLLYGNRDLEPSVAEQTARIGARRAWHTTRDIPAGTVLAPGDLVALRPCPKGTIPVSIPIEGISVKHGFTAGTPLTPEGLLMPDYFHQALEALP